MVQAGQELMQISDIQTQAEVAAAEATLRRAQAELAIVKTGGASGEVQLAREKLETARKRQQFAQAEADRLAKAYSRKAVSPQDYETARGAAAVRSQEVVEAQQQVRVIGNPARDERIAALQAEVLKAETELTYHKEQLANTHVRAPIAGRVVSEKLLFARGSYLQIGAPVAYIEDTTQLQAEIELPESTVGKIAGDARAWVRVWAFPGSSFEGRIVHIAPDAEKGDYGKIVRVRVLLDDPGTQLKPEMTGQAKVRSHWTIAGLAFTRAFVRFVLVEVWSWLP
jgi:multidrug resistance efflux pump